MPLHGEDHLIAHARLEAVGNDTQPIIGLMSFDVEGFAKCLFVKWIQEPDWMHSFEECYAIWLEGYSERRTGYSTLDPADTCCFAVRALKKHGEGAERD